VNVATAADGAPLLLISRLAVHTKNIVVDPRVSVMIDERKAGDPLQGPASHGAAVAVPAARARAGGVATSAETNGGAGAGGMMH
jgi:putative heme iron utilization protein